MGFQETSSHVGASCWSKLDADIITPCGHLSHSHSDLFMNAYARSSSSTHQLPHWLRTRTKLHLSGIMHSCYIWWKNSLARSSHIASPNIDTHCRSLWKHRDKLTKIFDSSDHGTSPQWCWILPLLLEEYLEPFSSDIAASNAEKITSMYRARNKP